MQLLWTQKKHGMDELGMERLKKKTNWADPEIR